MYLILIALLACSTTTDTAAETELPGDAHECPREGFVSVDPGHGWPLVATCEAGTCRSSSWALADTLTVPCTPASTVVVTWR